MILHFWLLTGKKEYSSWRASHEGKKSLNSFWFLTISQLRSLRDICRCSEKILPTNIYFPTKELLIWSIENRLKSIGSKNEKTFFCQILPNNSHITTLNTRIQKNTANGFWNDWTSFVWCHTLEPCASAAMTEGMLSNNRVYLLKWVSKHYNNQGISQSIFRHKQWWRIVL